MKNMFTKEKIVSLALVFLCLFLVNPFDIFMPSMIQMTGAAVFMVLFAVFASFVLKEDKGDEREEVLRSVAGRRAFLVGATLLTIRMMYEIYSHQLDVWLPVVLSSMILVKLYTRSKLD